MKLTFLSKEIINKPINYTIKQWEIRRVLVVKIRIK